MSIKHTLQSFAASLALTLASLGANAMTAADARNEIRYLEQQIGNIAIAYPTASMALLAMGGAAAAHMQANLDQDTLDALKVVAVVAGFYCLAEAEECSDVFVAINSRVGRINYLKRALINAGYTP